MVILVLPPVWEFIGQQLIGLPVEVSRLTHVALIILLPWPAAIGYRRFYQGLLIRDKRTRRVAYGTMIRLVAMVTTGFSLFAWSSWPGAYIGASALCVGVCVEAAASRWMVRDTLRRLLVPGTGLMHSTVAAEAVAAEAAEAAEAAPTPAMPAVSDVRDPAIGALDHERRALTFGSITRFYYPLALTSMLGLAVHPMVTFFMGHGRDAVESLAVLPVVNALTFVFRSFGLSFQEVAIVLMGKQQRHYPELARFATILGICVSAGLGLFGFTPVGHLWLESVAGLTPELAAYALPPLRILMLLPALSVLLSLQRAVLVQVRSTGPITWATVIEVGGIILVLLLLVQGWNLVGVTAAAWAFLLGRVAGNAYLIPPCRVAVRKAATSDAT
jgi:Na+-driven multidrug efflux pump